jgi:hypothetical protein
MAITLEYRFGSVHVSEVFATHCGGRDVVDSGADIAIESATRLNRPDIHPIHVDDLAVY